jgi:hypothetical protein
LNVQPVLRAPARADEAFWSLLATLTQTLRKFRFDFSARQKAFDSLDEKEAAGIFSFLVENILPRLR